MDKHDQTAILIADLGYGDAGKGSIVDYLTRQVGAHCVVRYNGGAQAAHNVITPDGKHHTFAQFGSGTLVPGAKTHLSRFMMVHPLAMLAEERHLRALGIADAFSRTSIDREALVTTPYQQAANRLKEMARGDARHGSCGMGVGETMSDWLAFGSDVLFAGDLADSTQTLKKLSFLRRAKLEQLESAINRLPKTEAVQAELKVFTDLDVLRLTTDLYSYFAGLVTLVDRDYLMRLLDLPGALIFEGAQGVLLDEWWGFYPYNSWSTLTYKNADQLLAECGYAGQVVKLGLVRAYATRHGAGPFVTEDDTLTAQVQDAHNADNPWQRQFRVGYLDFVALRYALAVTGKVDSLVVTNLDRMREIPEWKICDAYEYQGQVLKDIPLPADPTDLAEQEKLTRSLMDMHPVLTPCPRDLEAYTDLIGEKLELPVAVTSYGPTANEKLPNGGFALARQAQIPHLGVL